MEPGCLPRSKALVWDRVCGFRSTSWRTRPSSTATAGDRRADGRRCCSTPCSAPACTKAGFWGPAKHQDPTLTPAHLQERSQGWGQSTSLATAAVVVSCDPQLPALGHSQGSKIMVFFFFSFFFFPFLVSVSAPSSLRHMKPSPKYTLWLLFTLSGSSTDAQDADLI